MSNNNLVFLSNVRLSFPHIAEPQRQQGAKGERVSYNAEFILTPDNPAWVAFHQVVGKMALEKWGQHAQNVIAHCQTDRKKRCYGAGEEKVNAKTFAPYDGYPGHYYISAGRNQMPQIIKADGSPVDPTDTLQCQALARKMYGGCYVNAVVKPWLQENDHGRAIRADLVAVQFYADGAPFGEGAVDVTGMFGMTPAATSAAGANPAMPGAPAPGPAWAVPTVPGAPAAGPAMPGVPFPGAAPAMPAAPQFAPPTGLPGFLS